MLAVFLGIYSAGVTLDHWTGGRPAGLTAEVLFHGSTQIVAAAFTTSLVCMPLILIFGQIRGAYLGGSILAFFLGYSMLFFKGGVLSSLYPFSAALVLAGFDLSGYAGMTAAPDLGLAAAGVGVMSSGQGCCFCGPVRKKRCVLAGRPVPGGRREGLRRCKGLRPVVSGGFFQDLWLCRSTCSSFFILTHRTNVCIIRIEHTFFFETGDDTADRLLCV